MGGSSWQISFPPFFQQQPLILGKEMQREPLLALLGTLNTFQGCDSYHPSATWSHLAVQLLSFLWVSHLFCELPHSLPVNFLVVFV